MAADGHDDGRHTDLAVMDAHEYKQKRRLRRILDAHDKVEEVSDEAYGAFVEGVISADGKNIRILRAVQEYIRECFTLLEEHRETLEGEPCPFWHGSEDRGPLGRIEQRHADDIVFWGLRDVLAAQPLYTEEWEEWEQRRHGPDEFTTRSETHSVPEKVSVAAFLRLNTFLTEERDLVGVEFDDDSIPEYGFRELEDWEPEDGGEAEAEAEEVSAGGDD